jgi:hypothetical protein
MSAGWKEILRSPVFYFTLYFKALSKTGHMLRFHLRYFLLSVLLLGVEIFIGAYMHDDIIRPYGSDFLVVILIALESGIGKTNRIMV